MSVDWAPRSGRELGAETLREDWAHPARVVACLNIWNDLAALQQTLPTWYDHVDEVVAVDGAYGSTGGGLSTDGTREFLARLPKVRLLDVEGTTQFDKRNAYVEAGQAGDLLFVVDADEFVTRPEEIRALSFCDVGWCRIESPLYRVGYGQPRLFRWQPGLRYAGRHHWVYLGEKLLASHQYAGPGFHHRVSNVLLRNQRGLGHDSGRRASKQQHAAVQSEAEAPASAMPSSAASDRQTGAREALRILMVAFRDDGIAPSRLHTAVNRTTPHSSLFFKTRPGPFGVSGQYSTEDARLYQQALAEADVVHCHVTMSGLSRVSLRGKHVVFHHHGTMLRENAQAFDLAARSCSALVLVSNLELLSHSKTGHFLPNTVPVARYMALRERLGSVYEGGEFRVAHSPSKPGRKGTDSFLAVCGALQDRGVPIVPVLITGATHAEALATKATCHAAFDSFWLGLQCSGIEAAAMGMPVVAGDELVASRYLEHFGGVPYTFANDAQALERVLEQLVMDEAWRAVETQRVVSYVEANHDEAAVTLCYLDLLDEAFGWRAKPLQRRVRR